MALVVLVVLLPAASSRCGSVPFLSTLDGKGGAGAGEAGLHRLLVTVGGDQLPLPHPLDGVLNVSKLADLRL